VGEAQPATQMLGCFIGCAAVERHQRAGASLDPCDLGAPLVETDGRHFDTVRTAVDDLFEMMHSHCFVAARGWERRGAF
jgi:hypothetical protein